MYSWCRISDNLLSVEQVTNLAPKVTEDKNTYLYSELNLSENPSYSQSLPVF